MIREAVSEKGWGGVVYILFLGVVGWGGVGWGGWASTLGEGS